MLRTQLRTLVAMSAAGAAVLSPLATLSPAHAALPPAAHTAVAALPVPSHVVIVIEENHFYKQIIGSSSALYLNSLAGQGASFTDSHAITHPSQPNYLALFSGSTQGVTSDSCPQTFSAANLGSELIAAGLSFASYSESMPSDGYTGCTSGEYARKHNPASDFTNGPAAGNRTFAEFPPTSRRCRQSRSSSQPARRHARRHDRRGRHLAAGQHGQLRAVGQGQQQHPDRHR
ncbi:MAG TPA: alkaline phosphatase family protein [Streptosporangiaceae bacterium]